MNSKVNDHPDRTSRSDELRARFRATLKERVSGITGNLDRMRVGSWPGRGGDDLLASVRGLAGAAGLFGHDRLGDAARRRRSRQ